MSNELQIIPLRWAVLCANCDVVSNAATEVCPACGSPSLLNLSAALNPAPYEFAEVPA